MLIVGGVFFPTQDLILLEVLLFHVAPSRNMAFKDATEERERVEEAHSYLKALI